MCRTWQKKDAAMEGCETHTLVDNLINTPACNILEAWQKLLVKEFKMSDLSQQNTESTVIAENTGISLNWGTVNKTRKRITASALHKINSLPLVRKKKILGVRHQLMEGTYDIDKRLNAVLDHLLEELMGQDRTTDHLCPNAGPLTIGLST
jgi:hypothetical protein